MPDARSRPPQRLLGPLCASLLVHALVVGVAASAGITLIVQERAEASPLAIALKERVKLPPEPALPGPESAARNELPESFASALPEPELADPDFLAVLPPPPELVVTELAPESVPDEPPPEVAPEEELEPALLAVSAPADPAPVAPAPGAGNLGAGGGGAHARTGSPGAVGGSTSGTISGPILAGASATGTPFRGTGSAAGGGGGSRAVVVKEAKLLDGPAPAYPRLSRRTGEEGTVLCRLHLSDAGEVTLVDVVESSGFERLDSAAQRTLLRWRFEPRRLDGHAVAATLQHRVTFRLES